MLKRHSIFLIITVVPEIEKVNWIVFWQILLKPWTKTRHVCDKSNKPASIIYITFFRFTLKKLLPLTCCLNSKIVIRQTQTLCSFLNELCSPIPVHFARSVGEWCEYFFRTFWQPQVNHPTALDPRTLIYHSVQSSSWLVPLLHLSGHLTPKSQLSLHCKLVTGYSDNHMYYPSNPPELVPQLPYHQ